MTILLGLFLLAVGSMLALRSYIQPELSTLHLVTPTLDVLSPLGSLKPNSVYLLHSLNGDIESTSLAMANTNYGSFSWLIPSIKYDCAKVYMKMSVSSNPGDIVQ